MLAPFWRAAAAAVVLCAAAAVPAAAASEQVPTAGPAHCRFYVPEGWAVRDVRWSGACRAGLAEGRGTLRAYAGGRVVHSFFGRLDAGWPVLGVIERTDGYMAGRFEAGKAVNDGDRNTLIQAFDEASAAALQMAARFRQAGNTASALYYEGKARQLAQQMD